MSEMFTNKSSWVGRADFHLKIVREISDLVNQTTGLETILSEMVNKIARALDYDVVSIYLWDESRGKLVLRSTHGLRVDPEDPISLEPDEGLTGLVYTSRRPLVEMPASDHPNYRYFPEIGEEEYESYIGVPVMLQGRCLGVLIGQIKERRLINPAEETLFQIIASRLAGLLEVADRLERLKTPSILKHETKTYQGKGVSGGFALGTAYIFRGLFQKLRGYALEHSGVEEEVSRLFDALFGVEKELESLIENLREDSVLSENELDVFEAHRLILKDSTLRSTIRGKIADENLTAELAVIEGIEEVADHFENLSDPYIRERAKDFRDIGERILQHLLRSRGQRESLSQPEQGSVLIAEDVGPSLLANLNRDKVSAIVTEKGGETSHTVIIAKSLGIPAVVGVDKISSLIKPGERLIVDGKTGFVFSNPDKELIAEYENKYRKLVKVKQVMESELKEPKSTEVQVHLSANVGFPVDMEMARHYQIRDVGLFRTEVTFTRYDRFPGVREQTEIYQNVADQFAGYVTVRTLDIGADKILPYLDFPKEENPLLGLRAIRFSMEDLALFRDQIRAILLASGEDTRFRILLPMVSNLWEVETAVRVIEQLAKELGISRYDVPPLGIMMEVPAALYQLDDYSHLIDFVSVGTNDLIQYLLAVDRNSTVVGHLYSGFHPSVIRMLDEILAEGKSMGKEIYVCGEMAGTPSGALSLMALGYRRLSITPSYVPVIRYLGNRVNREILREIREKILHEKDEREIKSFLSEVIESIDPSLLEFG